MGMDVNENVSTDTAVQVPNQQESTSRKSKVIIAIIVALALGVLLVFSSNWITKTTGYGVLEESEYALTQCLTNMGAKMFGSVGAETESQKEIFGDSFRYVDYVECGDGASDCDGLSDLPAWSINGQIHYGVQSEDNLKILAGC
jgi:hypothetical protein